MNVLFNELALLEFRDAAEFYELEQAGLGRQFEEETKRSLRRIIRYPAAWSKEKGEIRRYLMHRFPYKILYSIEENHILILALAHLHRKPEYWVERRSER
jgi:hypothetical protein